MTYTLNIDKPALTLYKKLPKPTQQILLAKAQVLQTHPLVGKPLKGKYRLLRALHLTIDGTAYRLIYQLFARSETVVVRLAAPRGQIYRQLDAMQGKS